MSIHGFVIVDKPAGVTSHDVVNAARRLFKTKRVGHTGTLDPEATGVMVLCLGNGTRLAEYLTATHKQYVAEITFGVNTDTQDIWGQVTDEADASTVTASDVTEAMKQFRGTIYQIPPMVSARRHNGKHLYELARSGVTVEREARPIEIYRLELVHFAPGARPIAVMEITCSKGTYIRTLGYDIGCVLGVGAAMSGLRRTQVGSGEGAFTLNEAYTLDQLTACAAEGPARLADAVLPLYYAIRSWPQARLNGEQEADIRNGKALTCIEVRLVGEAQGDHPVALLNAQDELVAVAKITDTQTIQPVKVMASASPFPGTEQADGEPARET